MLPWSSEVVADMSGTRHDIHVRLHRHCADRDGAVRHAGRRQGRRVGTERRWSVDQNGIENERETTFPLDLAQRLLTFRGQRDRFSMIAPKFDVDDVIEIAEKIDV